MRIGEIIEIGIREPEVPDWQRKPVNPQPLPEKVKELEVEPEKVE